MNKKLGVEGFCCPGFIPPGAPDDFCIPSYCFQQRIETPKFPSPTSCLPRGLKERIDAVNELLLDLALSNERPEEGKMKSFEGLIGQLVEVKINLVESGKQENPERLNEDNNKILPIGHLIPGYLGLPPEKQEQKEKKKKKKKKKKYYSRKKIGKMKKYKKRKTRVKKVVKNKSPKRKAGVNKKERKLSGRVHGIGRDFVLIRRNKEEIFIPLIKISLIKPHDRFAQPTDEPELLDIDPCLRRALTFNFGKTVAASPELIGIFFKLTLPIVLLNHVDKKVRIKVANETLDGTLMEINKESLIISMRNKLRVIPLLSICFIILKAGTASKRPVE